MKDRLVTIALSVATTYGLMKSEPGPVKELEVDRLVVRKELIVSDTGAPGRRVTKHTRSLGATMHDRSATDPGGSGSGAVSSRRRSMIRSTTGSMPSSATAACAGAGQSRGTSGWTAPGADGHHPGRGAGAERGAA